MTLTKTTGLFAVMIATIAGGSATALPVYAATHHHHKHHHHATSIPQHNGGDRDADNNGGPSDGDGNI